MTEEGFSDEPIIIEIPRAWLGYAIQFALFYLFFQMLFYLGGA
tara:strand:- start:1093 stop:1221 length:129 start_codon:yes stop_codon:yes gene_type:complete